MKKLDVTKVFPNCRSGDPLACLYFALVAQDNYIKALERALANAASALAAEGPQLKKARKVLAETREAALDAMGAWKPAHGVTREKT